MKIFVSVDMEGATGVVHRDQLMPSGKTYSAARKLLTGDVNAAIEGALRVDPAADVVVADGHGVMRNILLEDLHEQARLVMGPAQWENRPLCQMQGVDESFDVAFLVGYHSRAGTPGGLLSHTWIGSSIANVRINGEVVGETAINATLLGSLGVPVGMAVGGDDLVAEARACLPEGATFVAVKKALGPTAAICLPPARTARLIAEAAEEASKRAQNRKLPTYDVKTPMTIEVETYRREATSKALLAPDVEARGDRAFATTSGDIRTAISTIWRAVARAQDEPPEWLK